MNDDVTTHGGSKWTTERKKIWAEVGRALVVVGVIVYTLAFSRDQIWLAGVIVTIYLIDALVRWRRRTRG